MTVLLYLASQLVALSRGKLPGVLGLAVSFLLVGAARAAWHALHMDAKDRAGMANESPLETWTQTALRAMGSPFWRKIRIAFNIVMFLYFALLMTGLAMVGARLI